MEFEQRKKAIEYGLQPFLSGESLTLALQIWEDRYAETPAFALQQFARELCDSFTLTMPRARVLLQQSLIRALNDLPTVSPTASPSPNPNPTPQVRPEPPSSMGDPAVHTFTLLVDTLTDRLSKTDGQFLRQYLLNHLSTLHQPEPAQQALRAWLNRRESITVSIPATALTQLINLAYIALCERLGPTQADQALHNTITRIETTNADRRYSVRRLL